MIRYSSPPARPVAANARNKDSQMLHDYHIDGRPGYILILIDPSGHIAAVNDWSAIKSILEKL